MRGALREQPASRLLSVPFPIAWLTVGAILVASLLVTAAPAHRAAHALPAVAVAVPTEPIGGVR